MDPDQIHLLRRLRKACGIVANGEAIDAAGYMLDGIDALLEGRKSPLRAAVRAAEDQAREMVA